MSHSSTAPRRFLQSAFQCGAAMLCAIFAVVGSCWAQSNILTNPGFESGNISAWDKHGCTISAQPSAARNGLYGGRVTARDQEWSSPIRQVVSLLNPGEGYHASLWIRPDAGTNLEVHLSLRQTDANGDTYKNLDIRFCPAGQWTQVSGGFIFAPTGTATGMTLYLHCVGDTSRSYDVDDASLISGVAVDLGASLGPVSTVGSGFLFGMTATQPPAQYFEGIKPELVRFHGNVDGTIGWGYNGGGTGFSSPAFMSRLVNAGVQRQVVVSDEYMWKGLHDSWGWPGDAAHDDHGPYDLIDQSVDSLLASAASNGYAGIQWDLWNEPDFSYFWGRPRAQFFDVWKHMFQRIRAADPSATIVGPSIAFFIDNREEGGWLKAFLLFAKANNCLPNILSWHEMVSEKHIPAQARIMREFMAANGISDRPIQINEYLAWGDDFTLSPGRTASFLSALQEAGVHGAAHAVWDEIPGVGSSNGLFDGRLGGIMTQDVPYQPRAPWHVYNSYAQMTGKFVPVVNGGLLRGLASIDTNASRAHMIIGNEGSQPFTTNIKISGLDQLPGFNPTGQVRARVREIPFSGTNALSAPTEISNQSLTPGANEISIPLAIAARAAYEITLSAETQQQSVTNGDFSSGGGIFGSSPTGWNASVGAPGVGQFTPGNGPQSPLSGQVAYMGVGTQILQTLGSMLQPDTIYTLKFQAYVSVSDGVAGDTLSGALAYGRGSGASSTYAGAIAMSDINSGSTAFSAALGTTAKSFTFSFRTKASITGSSNNMALYLNPSFTGGEQLYLDHVTLSATSPYLPTLSLTQESGNMIVISWHPLITDYVLETSPTLTLSSWSNVPGVVNNSVSLPLNPSKAFFRLRRLP